MSIGCTKYTVNFAVFLILLLGSIAIIYDLSGAFSCPPEITVREALPTVKFRQIPGELRKSYGTPEVFRVSFNETLKVPNYSYGLLTVPGNSCRNRNYFPDPELGTYGNYEFPAPDKLDHGHLIAASFVNQSCLTNVMSNIAPQWSCFNQGGGTWFQHEAYLKATFQGKLVLISPVWDPKNGIWVVNRRGIRIPIPVAFYAVVMESSKPQEDHFKVIYSIYIPHLGGPTDCRRNWRDTGIPGKLPDFLEKV